MSSITELIDLDICKCQTQTSGSDHEINSKAWQSISDNIESLRAERRSNEAERHNATKEILSKLHTLTAGANEAEERTTDVEDKLIVRKETDDIGIGS